MNGLEKEIEILKTYSEDYYNDIINTLYYLEMDGSYDLFVACYKNCLTA